MIDSPEPSNGNIKAILIAIVLLVVGAILGVGGNLLTTEYVAARQRNLNHQVVGFLAYTDTRYVPIVETQFWRRHVLITHIVIANNGLLPEEEVHVVLANTGEVGMAVQDPNSLANDRFGRPIEDFRDFIGDSKIDFVIPSIPSGGTYYFRVVSYTELESPLPTLSIQSKASVSKKVPSNQAWAGSLLTLLEGNTTSDGEGEWVKQVTW